MTGNVFRWLLRRARAEHDELMVAWCRSVVAADNEGKPAPPMSDELTLLRDVVRDLEKIGTGEADR